MGDINDITKLDDQALIKLAKKESRYFGALYDRYFEIIFRFVFKRLGGDEDQAGELTQITFIKAMANIEKYEDRGLKFSSWLYRIAQNEVLMYFREQKKVRYVPVDENRLKDLASEVQVNTYMSTEDQDKLISMINALEPEQMDLIELRFFQGMSFLEIAGIYNISEASAKMRIYRILERISKKWTGKEWENLSEIKQRKIFLRVKNRLSGKKTLLVYIIPMKI